MGQAKIIFKKWNNLSIVKRILIGMLIGIILSFIVPSALWIGIFGKLFVGMLKGIAPLLVFTIVLSAIAQHKQGTKTNMNNIIFLYLLGTFLASVLAVISSFIFKVNMQLTEAVKDAVVPKGVNEVFKELLLNIVKNPIDSIASGNYVGILFWAILGGLAFRYASNTTKEVLENVVNATSRVISWVIGFAPLGIMGLVFTAINENGVQAFVSYGKLILLLVGVMAFFTLVINPIIVFTQIRSNPYPLVFKCLRVSGITAFFTRSSAANIPINMKLCEDMGCDKDTYSVSIPLGSTINMAGASIVIAIMTLSAVHTLNIDVSLTQAILLSLISSLCACGTSGVAGGSLLLIPLACSVFGLDENTALQVVGVGFIIGVIQDSCETAINSSTDALYTIASDIRAKRKANKNESI